MSLAKTYSSQIYGLSATIVTIEVDLSIGLHAFSIVGLGDRAIEEAKDRISAAIKNSGYTSPKQRNQKVVIGLSPANTKKEGSLFDLGMAIAYLIATNDISSPTEKTLFLGELTLEGKIRAVRGIIPMIIEARESGFAAAFIPNENIYEASLVKGIGVFGVSSLIETVHLLKDAHARRQKVEIQNDLIQKWAKQKYQKAEHTSETPDFTDIRGQNNAKRALEIAAAGGHSVALYGPPGTGKTMLAKAFSSLLPALSYEETIEVTTIHSVAHTLKNGSGVIRHPPFRAPHHTSSYSAIVGGGGTSHIGEITLAHRGVLFLDEFTEFDKRAIDALREPLENHSITVARTNGSTTLPAQCIFIVAMNPCQCGKSKPDCVCSNNEIKRYRRKISGPIIDRIDLWIFVETIEYEDFGRPKASIESSAKVRERIVLARSSQKERYTHKNSTEEGNEHVRTIYNSQMSAKDIETLSKLSVKAKKALNIYASNMKLSGRGYHRAIKVARTIADLANKVEIEESHILEALQYRKRI